MTTPIVLSALRGEPVDPAAAKLAGVEDPSKLDQVPPRDQVAFLVQRPGSEEPVVCDYEVLDGGRSEIMAIYGALPAAACAELTATLEIDAFGWSQGTQVNSGGEQGAATYTGEGRTSKNKPLAGPALEPWRDMIDRLLWDAARFYRCWNKHVVLGRQDGWEVMRYREGDRFGLHVDAIAGNPAWGQRQLSVLLYLNDGYVGGETAFPRHGLELRLPAGSIALFPPFWTHPHEAKPVTQGTKYCVVGWFYP